jgi:hypothetical protein
MNKKIEAGILLSMIAILIVFGYAEISAHYQINKNGTGDFVTESLLGNQSGYYQIRKYDRVEIEYDENGDKEGITVYDNSRNKILESEIEYDRNKNLVWVGELYYDKNERVICVFESELQENGSPKWSEKIYYDKNEREICKFEGQFDSYGTLIWGEYIYFSKSGEEIARVEYGVTREIEYTLSREVHDENGNLMAEEEIDCWDMTSTQIIYDEYGKTLSGFMLQFDENANVTEIVETLYDENERRIAESTWKYGENGNLTQHMQTIHDENDGRIFEIDCKYDMNGNLEMREYIAYSIYREIIFHDFDQTGGDPPLYGDIMAFPTPEKFLGSDLNGDSDMNDTILRYQDLKSRKVVNTGLITSGAYHSIDIYENITAFVGENSHIFYYDLNTDTVGETGASGTHPSIYGNIIAFSSEGIIHYFDLSTQTLVNTEVPGYSPVIYQDVIVFHAFTPEFSILVYDLSTGETVNTGAIGKNPAIYENIIAFETSESSISEDLNGDGDTYDIVIRFYDLETHTITNTGGVGLYPAIYGNRIVFATLECNIYQDLNGDNTIFGEIIRYYDIKTGELVNTRKMGTQPSIYKNTITFFLWENWVNQDLNGDGDQSDPIVRTYMINGTEIVRKTQISGCF